MSDEQKTGSITSLKGRSFSKKGLVGSLVLVAQVGAPMAVAADRPTASDDVPAIPALRARDFSELEIPSASSNKELRAAMKDWSAKAFLSLVPAISDAAKMRASLLKIRTIVHEEFLTRDLASLAPHQQSAVKEAFFAELEHYTERMTLISQLVQRAEDGSVRELASSALKGILSRAPRESKLFAYLCGRTVFEVSGVAEKDPELFQIIHAMMPEGIKVNGRTITVARE